MFTASLNCWIHSAILLITLEDDLWWPLWWPLKNWAPRAILLVSSSPSCWKKNFLKSTLSQTTPSVVIICPDVPREASLSKNSYKLWTWLPFSKGQKLVDLGIWRPESFQIWEDLFIDRFHKMDEKRMTILANAIDRPFFYTRSNGESAGQTFQIVEALSQWLNFDYEITSGASVNYSIMTELVKKGENDLMFNYATPTLDRYRDFQLTVPYAYEGFGLMLGVPPPLPRWQNLLYPFSWQVWTATVISLFSAALTFHCLHRHKEKSFINNAITVSQSILSNPLEFVPAGWRTRYFLLVWWTSSWILTVSYTCNLIAILTVPVFATKIQTSLDLAKSNYRLCMVDYGEFVPEALATSTQPTFFALGAKMDLVPVVDHLPEMGEEACVKHVLAGSHSHTEAYPYAATLYSMMGLNTKVYALKERLYPSYLVILIYKHAPWKLKFDKGMERLREAGLMQKWYQEAMEEFGVKAGGKSSPSSLSLKLKSLSLGHLQGSFLLLLSGFIGGFLAMAGEIFLPKSNNDHLVRQGISAI